MFQLEARERGAGCLGGPTEVVQEFLRNCMSVSLAVSLSNCCIPSSSLNSMGLKGLQQSLNLPLKNTLGLENCLCAVPPSRHWHGANRLAQS